MIDITKDPKEVINELSSTEKKILYVLGKNKFSVNKNFNLHTLKKKLSNEDKKNFKRAFDNLYHCGIIETYRSENYCVSKEGRKIAQEIVNQKRAKIYDGLRIMIML